MSLSDKDKWEQRYHLQTDTRPEAARVLSENTHLLPDYGTALDLACGRGGNALCLAQHGLNVDAWDIAENALEHVRVEAQRLSLDINLINQDVMQSPPDSNHYDVIVVSRFLERHLFQTLKAAVKPEGLIYYQTFIVNKPENVGPSNPAYLLNDNELLTLFSDWHVCVYREEGNTGKPELGFRNEAYIIAKKRGE